MDIKTIVILTVEGRIPAEEGLNLIAQECGVTTDSLIQALTSSETVTTLSARRWTMEDDGTVIKMWASGASAGTIARALARTRNSVSQRVHYLRGQGHDLEKRETAGMNRIRQNRTNRSGATQLKLPGF
jgi:hypothetical protein